MMRPLHLTPLLLCSALLLLTPTWASAQASAQSPRSPNRCQEDYAPPEASDDPVSLAMLGIACFERGEFGRALAFYRRAYAQSRAPLLEAAIGRSLHELGIWSAALAYYELYLDHEQDDRDGRARIQERLDRLNAQLEEQGAIVTLDAFPGTAIAYIQTSEGHREVLGPTPLKVRLKPRDYTFIIERDGFHLATQDVNLSPRQKLTIKQELIPQNAAFTLTSRQFRRAGGITMLASAPLITLGGVIAVLGEDTPQSQGQALLIVGTTSLVIGATLAIIGVQRERRMAQDRVTLSISPGHFEARF